MMNLCSTILSCIFSMVFMLGKFVLAATLENTSLQVLTAQLRNIIAVFITCKCLSLNRLYPTLCSCKYQCLLPRAGLTLSFFAIKYLAQLFQFLISSLEKTTIQKKLAIEATRENIYNFFNNINNVYVHASIVQYRVLATYTTHIYYFFINKTKSSCSFNADIFFLSPERRHTRICCDIVNTVLFVLVNLVLFTTTIFPHSLLFLQHPKKPRRNPPKPQEIISVNTYKKQLYILDCSINMSNIEFDVCFATKKKQQSIQYTNAQKAVTCHCQQAKINA